MDDSKRPHFEQDPTTGFPVAADCCVLGLFAKAWDAGKVKTRLARTLGDDVAVRIYFQLLTLQLNRIEGCRIARHVAYCPDTSESRARFADLTGPEWQLVPQIDSDLGSRMSHFFQQAFAQNCESRVVVIGSDAPRLSNQIVDQAFELLDNHDVVFGPSTDGGYYLVGLSRMVDEIFRGVPWSTERVLQQSLEICRREELSVAQLPALSDIDTEQDLQLELERLRDSDEPLVQNFVKSVESLLGNST